jgi:pSer/pThr/pTyr-binding forkhead associated (FHA) protein
MNLVIEDEAGTRSIVPFTGDEIVVGRAAEDVTFRLGDRNVSRRHARFLRQNGVTWVEDLGSLTGTMVNGERITARRKLRGGDLVQIGDYDLAVVGEVAAVAPGEPPPLPRGATLMLEPITDVPVPALAPAPAPPAPAPAPPERRTFRVALAAGVIALVLGVAAGWAVGIATAPEPPRVTRP